MNTIGNRHMHYDYIFDLMNGYTYAPYRSDTRLLFEKYNTMYSEISFGHYDYDDVQQFYEQFFADYGSLAIYDIGNSDIKLLDAQNKIYEFMTGHPFQSVSYISSLNLRKLDLKHPLEVNGTTDSDSDGLTDWEEVLNEGNLITHDGTRITALPTYEKYVNYALRNTDRAESIRTFIRKKIGVGRFNIVKNIKVLPLKSNPRKRDTDGDGIDDKYDKLSVKPINGNFQTISSFEMNFKDIFPNSYKEKYDEIEAIYDKGTFKDIKDEIKYKSIKAEVTIMALGGHTPLSSLLNDGDWGRTPVAANLLLNYLYNSDEYYSINEFPYAIALTKSQRESYYNLLNNYMDLVEDTVVEGEDYYFSTTPNSNYIVSYYENVSDSIENDWRLAIGYAKNGLISEVNSYNDNGKTYYSANVKFYVFDCYKWSDDSSEGDLYDLHYYGLAHSFKDYGCYETIIKWEKGYRYPKKVKRENMSDIAFEGILDMNLASAYLNGYFFYNNIYFAI